MNAKAITSTMGSRISRTRFNPIRNLRPETITTAIDEFQAGRLGNASKIFEAILQRDDILCGLNTKRKKSVARLESEIVLTEDSPKAHKHKKVLSDFYKSIKVTSVSDKNQIGSLRMLISQMMDSVPFKYAIHNIEFKQVNGRLIGEFTHYPLWLFENTTGVLRQLDNEYQTTDGKPLKENSWMITCGDGLMIPSSLAFIFKQLPLKDWLIYCERNGMPGIKAKTDAFPNSPQWEAACDAVADFGAEFHAVMSEGTDIEAIDVSNKGELPYPVLVERTDRILASLWRGGDLSTLSGKDNLGSTAQTSESILIEEDDAASISETLNRNVDKQVIKILLGDDEPLAKIKLKTPDYQTHKYELEIIERLVALGLKADNTEIAKRFAFPLAKENEIEKQENKPQTPPQEAPEKQSENPSTDEQPKDDIKKSQPKQNEIQ